MFGMMLTCVVNSKTVSLGPANVACERGREGEKEGRREGEREGEMDREVRDEERKLAVECRVSE